MNNNVQRHLNFYHLIVHSCVIDASVKFIEALCVPDLTLVYSTYRPTILTVIAEVAKVSVSKELEIAS